VELERRSHGTFQGSGEKIQAGEETEVGDGEAGSKGEDSLSNSESSVKTDVLT